MADSMKATVTDGVGSYVELAGLSLDDFGTVYVGVEVLMTLFDNNQFLSGAFHDSPLFMWARKSGGALVDLLGYFDSDSDGFYDVFENDFDGDIAVPSPPLLPNWHIVEWQRDPTNGPGPLTVTVDGVAEISDAFGPSGTIASLRFGAAQVHLTAPTGGSIYIARIRVGTTPGGSDVLDWDAADVSDLSAFSSVTGTVTLETAPSAPTDWPGSSPPSPGARKNFRGFPWRFIFTDLSHVVTTWASGIQRDRQIGLVLNSPTGINGTVQSDSRRVNELWPDGYPRVAQTLRMVHCFRREAPDGGPPWIIRAAGIVETVQDEGDPDVAVTHWAAFDPWTLASARPCMQADGNLPDPTEGMFMPYTADVIVGTLLKNTIDNEGTCFIDAGTAYGGTAFWGTPRPDGTTAVIETCDEINVTVQPGQMVGEIWSQLCDAGVCDIVLDPIWDPINRPGYTHELSVYRTAGVERPSAVFAWDRLNRSVASISRMHDAQPGQFFDKVQYFAGQGGPPIPALGPLVNAPAVAAFGSWWSQQFFPSMTDTDPTGAAVLALAAQALVLSKQGKRTMTMTPTPERAPVSLIAYGLGDLVPIYASKRLRVTADGLQRVQAIPISISDDDVETIGGLLCSPDYRGAP